MATPVILPMLTGATGVRGDPSRFLFEPKLDGQRIIARVDGGDVRLMARSQADATECYPELAALGAALGGRGAVLDGEVVAFDERGRPDFQTLQARMHVRRPAPQLVADVPTVYVAFDLLWLDGSLLTGLPQEERRAELEALELAGPSWQTVGLLTGDPDDLLDACRSLGLEGFVAKRRDAPYTPGRRSPAWAKIKAFRQREFVVGGVTEGEGGRRGSIGSLALGYYDDAGALRYVGQAGSGLSERLVQQLSEALVERGDSPFAEAPTVPRLRWVEPSVVVQIAFAERTRVGTLRHPVVKGLRTDLAARTVGYDDELATGG